MSESSTCGGSPCSGYCVSNNGTAECVGQIVYRLCYIDQAYLIYMILVLMLPNLVCFAASFLPRMRRAPVCSFLTNLMTNAAFACAIFVFYCFKEDDSFIDSVALIYVTFYATYYLFYHVHTCCYTPQSEVEKGKDSIIYQTQRAIQEKSNGNQKIGGGCCFSIRKMPILYEMSSSSISKDDLNAVIAENAMLPPVIEYTAVAYHFENRGGGQNGAMKITSTVKQPLAYQSWQDKTEPVKVPNSEIVMFYCKPNYELTPDAEAAAAETKGVALGQVQGTDDQSIVFPTHRVEGFTEFTIAHNKNQYVICLQSKFSIIFYHILIFIGYHSIVDTIWRSLGDTIKYEAHKLVSMDTSLSAHAGERDRSAQDRAVAPINTP